MLKKIRAVLIGIILFSTIITVSAHADSMITSCPVDTGEDSAIPGVEYGEFHMEEAFSAEATAATTKDGSDIIWGPVTNSSCNNIEEEKKEEEVDVGNLPAIGVAYRVRVNNPQPAQTDSQTPYRYKHQYSSRSGYQTASPQQPRYEVKYINITPIIVREAEKNNLPPVLLKAVIQTESNFDTYAVSGAGAMGLMQLMPGTAREVGLTDPYNPEQNIIAGAKYLGQMFKRFGSIELALAAYNAGPGTVSRCGGIPDIYETQRYIVKVKGSMHW